MILDKNKVKCQKHTIAHACHLKNELSRLGIKHRNSTAMSMDAEAMHPSIKFALVKKAVLHCAKKLSEDETETIVFCLELIKFSMGSATCMFQDKHCEHIGPEGDCKVEEKCVGEMQSPRGKRESEWASARECTQNREFSRIDRSRVGAKTSKGTRMSNENVAHKSITFLI